MTSKELRALYNRLDEINERIEHIMQGVDRRYLKAVLEEKKKEETKDRGGI